MSRDYKRDEVVGKPSSYEPSKKDLEEVYKVEDDTKQPIGKFGKTQDEQFGSLVRHIFRAGEDSKGASMKTVLLTLIGLSMLSGCDKDQRVDIQPMYFSPSAFMNMSCEDLFGFAYNAELEVERIKEAIQGGWDNDTQTLIQGGLLGREGPKDPALFRIPILGWGYTSPEGAKYYYDGLEDKKQEERNARELISTHGQSIAARTAYNQKGCHPVQSDVVEQGS